MKHRSTDIVSNPERELDDLLVLPRPVYGHALSLPNRAIERHHRHPWAQLSYAIRGMVEVTSATARFMAPPLRAVWIPPGQAHGVRCSADATIRSLYIDARVDPRQSATCHVIEVGNLLRELIRAFSAMPVDYDEQGPEGRLATVLLDELARAPEAGLVLPWPKDARLREVCRNLQAHPRSTRTLQSYSRALAVSDKTLSRLFRHETGISFRLWRQRSRLFSALPLLQRGDRVTDVAQACGYESMSAFIAAFRNYMGATPGDFFSADAPGAGHARPGPPRRTRSG